MRNFVAAVAVLTCCAPSYADSEIPFPQLKTKMYCTELVSKMLNKEEQKVEFDKCILSETSLKEALQPYWSIVRPVIRKKIVTYFTEPKFETYITVYQYENQEIGNACLKKVIDCRLPN